MGRSRRHILCAALGGIVAVGTASLASAQSAGGDGELPAPSELGEAANPPSPDEPVPLGDSSEDPPPGTKPSGDWRVQLEDEPPLQVKQAADRVTSSARSVAASIAGGESEGSAESDSDEASADSRQRPRVRRLRRKPTEEGPKSTDRPAGTPAVEDPSSEKLLGSIRRLFRDDRGEKLSLEPYVDDPRWDRAMQLLVDNHCRKALDRADTVIDESKRNLKNIPAVRYAVARIKLCAGQPGEGRRTMRALRRRDDVVGELARRRLGDTPGPVRAGGEGEGTWTDQLRRARDLASNGEVGEALEQLARLRGELHEAWRRYKVRMTEVNVLLRDGRVAEAGRSLVGIYRMVSDWRIGDRVADKIERIERRHGVDILPLPARVDRMRGLILRGKYEKAHDVSIENAKLAGVGGSEIRGWSFYRRALEAEHRRRRERAADLFEKAERLVDSPIIRSRLYYGWARALRRLDRDEKAIELYRRLCREYPRHHLCDDARFEVGRLNQYHDNHERAREAFTDLVGLQPDSERVPDALWRGAFSAYLMGDYEAVDGPLRRLVSHYSDETDVSGLPLGLKARYWLGVAAFRRGEIELAKRRLQETINKGALTWYGRLAARRMKRIGADPVVPLPQERLSPSEIYDLSTMELPDDARYRVAAEYARLGLYENAIAEMERQLEIAPVPEKARRLLANLHLVDDRPAKAHWMMHAQLDSPTPTRGELREWGLAYPVEFREHGRRYGTKFDVSPYLVQAIMRQESGFRPAVSSGVGAVGLMQLMPGTANVISDDFFDGSHMSRSELQQPKTNIRLGSAYTRAMVAWVRGRVPMALAGYNAGPAPLKDWFERYGDRQIDAWVESITYRQARGYVRKVYTSYVRYAALYSGELPQVRLELPEDFREWGDVPALNGTDPSSDPVSLLRR